MIYSPCAILNAGVLIRIFKYLYILQNCNNMNWTSRGISSSVVIESTCLVLTWLEVAGWWWCLAPCWGHKLTRRRLLEIKVVLTLHVQHFIFSNPNNILQPQLELRRHWLHQCIVIRIPHSSSFCKTVSILNNLRLNLRSQEWPVDPTCVSLQFQVLFKNCVHLKSIGAKLLAQRSNYL